MTTRTRASIAGVVAVAAALGISELPTAASGGSSLITAVGGRFVDRFAGSLKDFAVRTFGTGDKAALVIGVVVVALLIGAVIGPQSLRRRWIGAAAFGAFALLGVACGFADPQAKRLVIIGSAILAASVGIVVLYAMLRLLEPAMAAKVKAPTAASVAARPMDRSPGNRTASRRGFLVWTGAGTAVAVGGAGVSRAIRSDRLTVAVRNRPALPAPASTPAPGLIAQPFSVEGLTPYIVPTADFYRIDTALIVPQVNPATWKLKITGMVDHPFEVTLDELAAMELVEQPVTIACVSNEVGGDLIGNAIWRGVPLKKLLDRAGVHPDATQIVGRSVDGFTAGFPTAVGLDGRTALLALGMNGEPLTSKHGYPARLIIAGLYGYVSATKWLSEIKLTTLDAVDGYWIPRGWAKEAPVKTESRIDVPRSSRVSSGRTAVAGVAWAPTRGISKVEVQLDSGDWAVAKLGAVASSDTWVQWMYEWDAKPGNHVIAVRATDGTGAPQTAEQADPAPDGASGYHTRRFAVS